MELRCNKYTCNLYRHKVEWRFIMVYVNLEDMKLSQFVLGTDGYGERIDKKTAFDIMNEYTYNGGNIIDTARLYCDGMSEKYVGEFIKGKRDDIYVSTKCAHPPLSDMTKNRLSESEIEYDIDLSLKTMGIDYIDILWLHRDDITVSVEPIIDALNNMHRKGKIRYFGASNWTHDRIMLANEYAKASNQMGFIASQPLYNLAVRSKVWDETLVCLEGEEKDKYDKSHFPVFAFSSQAKGFFEKYAQNQVTPKAKNRYMNSKTLEIFEKVKEKSLESGDTISYTALSMLIDTSNFNVFPIIGPSNVEQLRVTMNIK